MPFIGGGLGALIYTLQMPSWLDAYLLNETMLMCGLLGIPISFAIGAVFTYFVIAAARE